MTLKEYRHLLESILQMKMNQIDLDEDWDYYAGMQEAMRTIKASAFLTGGEEE